MTSTRQIITWKRFKEIKINCKLCCGSKLCPHHQYIVDKYFEFVFNKPWVKVG